MNKQVVKVRATAHRGRTGKHGAYNPKHNDRNFDVRKSDHIDIAKSTKNLYWHCYRQTMPNMTFEDAESKFYEEHFSDALSQKNAHYIKNRHKERVQTMDEYRMSDRYCPEEIIYQLGDASQQRPSSNTLIQIINEFNLWQRSLWYEKRNVVRICILTMALHRDEPNAADHVHIRQVYMVKNKDGYWEVNQEEALKRIGIERGDPSKERGRYNNRKKKFTEIARAKFIEIAKSRGVDIIEEPKDVGKSGLELMQYKAQQEQSNLDELRLELKCLERDYIELQIEKDYIQAEVDKLRKHPALQQPKLIERDEYIKDYYPHVWEMADRYTKHTKTWTPSTNNKVSRSTEIEFYR